MRRPYTFHQGSRSDSDVPEGYMTGRIGCVLKRTPQTSVSNDQPSFLNNPALSRIHINVGQKLPQVLRVMLLQPIHHVASVKLLYSLNVLVLPNHLRINLFQPFPIVIQRIYHAFPNFLIQSPVYQRWGSREGDIGGVIRQRHGGAQDRQSMTGRPRASEFCRKKS